MSGEFSYIASGFYEDCVRLMENFENSGDVTFKTFCEIWKNMKFSLVFLCRKTYAEILEFCEESINIAKQFLLTSNELYQQIFGLYLLYGLYYKIPVENVKIRVTANEWQSLLSFYQHIKEEKFYDASYIFIKLATNKAFHFCLFPTEYGLEKMFKIRQEHPSDNPHSILPNLIEDVEEGELANIQELSRLYDQQKAKLLNLSSSYQLELFDKTFMDDMIEDLEKLQEKRHLSDKLKKNLNKKIQSHKSKILKSASSSNKIRPKVGHGFDTDSSADDDINTDFDLKINDQLQSQSKSFDAVIDEDEDSETDYDMTEIFHLPKLKQPQEDFEDF